MTTTIRLATAGDLAGVGALTVAAYVDDGHVPADADYTASLADAARRAADAELWVAVDAAGRVLGSITFAAPGSPFAEVSDPHEGELRMLAVAGEARGTGVGAALVHHCVVRARELGLGGLSLSTLPSMTAAHRIYERAGFTRTPERDWEPVPGVLLITYRLELAAAG